MSQEQKDVVDALLRQKPLAAGVTIEQQRAIFEEMASQLPVPKGISIKPRQVGDTSGLAVGVEGAHSTRVIVYVHGGAFAIGTARSSAPLAGDLARRAKTNLITVDYRLAPEHPFPAAIDDVVSAYQSLLHHGIPSKQIAFAGESAGAGLVLSALLRIRDTVGSMPASAFLMSPWADLTLSGNSVKGKATVDPANTAQVLSARAQAYANGNDVSQPLMSPAFADFHDLPPLLVQVGSHEMLLSDAVRVAERAGTANVDVTLEIVAGVPHGFQWFASILEEGAMALDRAARFIDEHF